MIWYKLQFSKANSYISDKLRKCQEIFENFQNLNQNSEGLYT
jgi:hypothetical protein